MKTRELNHQLRSLETMLPHAMQDTRQSVKREIRRIRQRKGATGDNNDNNQKIQNRISTLEKKLHHSAAQKNWRKNHRPALSYDDNLPIVARLDDIISAIKRHQVVIISGETGSGKTTQLPKFCIDAGRGIDGLIGCTQPRRIAAMTVAQRIATEMNEPLGRSVGYKIRFADRMDQKTAFVKMMTDGILLAEAQSDRFLNRYDTLIIDEAHERSLNIDFILGILRNLLPTRKDLKLIITSATIDTEKFSKAFENAPVIEVSGRMYPVEVRYWRAAVKEDAKEESDGQSIVDLAADAVGQHRGSPAPRGYPRIHAHRARYSGNLRNSGRAKVPAHHRAAPLRPAVRGGSDEGVCPPSRAKNRGGHQRGRNIRHGSRHPLCGGYRNGPDFQL